MKALSFLACLLFCCTSLHSQINSDSAKQILKINFPIDAIGWEYRYQSVNTFPQRILTSIENNNQNEINDYNRFIVGITNDNRYVKLKHFFIRDYDIIAVNQTSTSVTIKFRVFYGLGSFRLKNDIDGMKMANISEEKDEVRNIYYQPYGGKMECINCTCDTIACLFVKKNDILTVKSNEEKVRVNKRIKEPKCASLKKYDVSPDKVIIESKNQQNLRAKGQPTNPRAFNINKLLGNWVATLNQKISGQSNKISVIRCGENICIKMLQKPIGTFIYDGDENAEGKQVTKSFISLIGEDYFTITHDILFGKLKWSGDAGILRYYPDNDMIVLTYSSSQSLNSTEIHLKRQK